MRSVSIRWSLLGSMLALLVLLSGAIAAVSALGERRTVQTLSRGMTARTIEQTIDRLERFFEPVDSALLLLRSWGEAGLLDGPPEALERLLAPVLRPHAQLSALLIADERGRSHMLLRTPDRWQSREVRRDLWGARMRLRTWTDAAPTPALSWSDEDYDPRTRPWYRGAVQGWPGAAAPASPAPPFVHWTEPYTFFTLKVPGVTASTIYPAGRAGGRGGVVAVDVLLADVSAYTSTLRPTPRGLVVALTDDGRVVGLPQGAGRAPLGAQALLQRPEDVGLGAVVAAVRAAPDQGDGDRGPARFLHGGEAWWGEVRKFPLGGDRALSIAVLVPEADILGTLGAIRWWIVLFTIAALGLAAVWAVRLALRYSRPIEVLARENERIGQGDLEAGPEVRSSVTEVQRLVRAHERMRLALRTLFKVERDLQLARQIQQSTLPEALPALPGFDVDAWCEPADATGGDTYDVIGLRAADDGAPSPGGEGPLATGESGAERAVLFLADADGHGIGPALSVTLARAMLRMGLRAGLDLPAIVRRMNAQLAADLRDGHFVTAWLGVLDVRAGTLTCVCCGHGPVLHWVAAEDDCRVIPADTVPLGILSDIEPGVPVATRLAPGDAVVVMSDGVFDALNAAGEPFGAGRVVALLRAHRGAPAPEILGALRTALDAFTGGAPAEDDRTAIVLTCRSRGERL